MQQSVTQVTGCCLLTVPRYNSQHERNVAVSKLKELKESLITIIEDNDPYDIEYGVWLCNVMIDSSVRQGIVFDRTRDYILSSLTEDCEVMFKVLKINNRESLINDKKVTDLVVALTDEIHAIDMNR